MNPNKNDPVGNWLNIVWNVVQTITFVIYQFQQNNYSTYDRKRLDSDVRIMKAENY